jgi:hypothetical protein
VLYLNKLYGPVTTIASWFVGPLRPRQLCRMLHRFRKVAEHRCSIFVEKDLPEAGNNSVDKPSPPSKAKVHSFTTSDSGDLTALIEVVENIVCRMYHEVVVSTPFSVLWTSLKGILQDWGDRSLLRITRFHIRSFMLATLDERIELISSKGLGKRSPKRSDRGALVGES